MHATTLKHENFVRSLRDFLKVIFPPVMAQLLEESIKPDPDFKKIAKLIGYDPGLSATILSLVNTPYFGLPQKVTDLERAAVILGNREVLKLALSITFQGRVNEHLRQCHQDIYDNWSLIIWSSIASQLLAERLCPEEAGQVYLCTLLKDISLLLVCASHPDQLPEFEGNEALLCIHPNQLKAEADLWGENHAQLSQAILQAWDLPLSLCKNMAFHHDFAEVEQYDPFSRAIILATKWSEVEYQARSNPGLLIRFKAELAAILRITPEELEDLRTKCIEQFKVFAQVLKVAPSSDEARIFDLPLSSIQSTYFLSLDLQNAVGGLEALAGIVARHLRFNFEIKEWELALARPGQTRWAFFRVEGGSPAVPREFSSRSDIPWHSKTMSFVLRNSKTEFGELRVSDQHFTPETIKEVQLYCRFFSLQYAQYQEAQAVLEMKAQTLEKLPLGVAWLSFSGEIQEANQKMADFFNAGETIVGRIFWPLLKHAKAIDFDPEWERFLATPAERTYNRVFCPLGFDSQSSDPCFYVSAHKTSINGMDGIMALVEDVSEITDLQCQALQQREFLEGLLTSMQDTVFIVDSKGKISFAPKGLAEKLVGRNFFELAKPMGIYMESWDAGLLERDEGPVQVNLTLGSEVLPLEIVTTPLKKHAGYSLLVGRDLSTIMRLEEKIKRQAIYDHLTGVFNRHQFQIFLDREVDRSRRNKQEMGLIFLDVDGLKKLNDAQGHTAGDTMLKDLGRIIRQVYRRGMDFPCRYGGDEFVVLLTGLESNEQLELVGKRFKAAVDEHFQGQITLSLGLAMLHADETGESLVDRADRASYEAKTSGGNRIIWAK